MKTRMVVLAAALGLSLSICAHAAWIDPVLEDEMASAKAGDPIDIYVVLKDQVDLTQVIADVERRGGSLAERHYAVITRLRDLAEDTQGSVLSQLDRSIASGEATEYRSFWISNSIGVKATPRLVGKLALRPDVASIYLDYPIELIAPVDEGKELSAGDLADVESGIVSSRAPELWALGITGEGRLACDQDTGADGTHPAFASRWRGLDSGVDPSEAWFDPVAGQIFPTDSGTHGTHTLGTILGDDGADHQVGMAPGAKWIGAKTIDVPGGDIFTDAVAAFEWAADPDGDPATVDDVPDVVSNSWGLHAGYYGPCRTDFNQSILGAEAAGVIVVFAAGNEGTYGLRSPANMRMTDLTVFSIGALNQDNTTIASFSSQGPTDCDEEGDEGNFTKPEISAVGVDVLSSVPGGSYGTKSGTSMATPHVAGAVLLLRQAFPFATPEEIKYGLYMSSVDLGTEGEDNVFGRGRLDMVEAYLFLMDYLINSDGDVKIGDWYSCDDTISIDLADADLDGPTASVTIASDSETTPETVTLAATDIDGKYTGTIDTSGATPSANGTLEISHGDTITVTYIDADDGEGGYDVTKTDEALADCRAPDFDGVREALSGDNQAILHWDAATDDTPVTYHVYRSDGPGQQDFSTPIADVTETTYVDGTVVNGQTYWYVVRAEDAVGNKETNRIQRSVTPIGPVLIWIDDFEEEDKAVSEWTIRDNTPGSYRWRTDNPGSRSSEYWDGTFFIADSDREGTHDMDTELISPPVDCSGYRNLQIRFGHYFRSLGEYCDVDVRIGGGEWVNAAEFRTTTEGDALIQLDESVDNATDIELRFHYYNANYDWWWGVDNVALWGWEDDRCRDDDMDGYGSPGRETCAHPEEDCDDTNSDINPGADEVCDGIDNNCSDEIDEGGDALCDDGLWCNGPETCWAEAGCADGGAPCEGWDDGVFCNGPEFCDEEIDECSHEGDPCEEGTICVEDTNSCDPIDDGDDDDDDDDDGCGA